MDDSDGINLNPGDDVIEEGIDKQVPTQTLEESDEESVSGSTTIPTADDDVEEMVEEAFGRKPKPGEVIADIVNEAELDKTVGLDEEEETEKNDPETDDPYEKLKDETMQEFEENIKK